MDEHRMTVLLVEDNVVDQIAFERLVRREALPYDCTVARSVAEGRNALESSRFDVVVLDYMLGDGTCFDLFEKISEDVPFIVMTGSGDEEVAVRAIKKGAAYYVIKDQNQAYIQTLPIILDKAIAAKQAEVELRRYHETLEEMVEKRTAQVRETNKQLLREIDKHKHTAVALRESEKKYRELVSNVQLGIYRTTLDPDGIWVEVNPAIEKITGYSRDELLAMKVVDLYAHPDERKNVISQTVLHGGVTTSEIVFRKKDGNIIIVSSTKYPVKGRNQEILYFDGFLEDITERKRVEHALRESEANYRLLVENQTDLMVKVDTEGKFLFVSPSYCNMFGKAEAELLGSEFMPVVHEDDRDATVEAMKRLHHPPHTAYVEQRAMTKDGWKWLAWVDTAVVNDAGKVMEIIGVGRDITEQREAEGRLRESEEQFRAMFDNAPIGIALANLDYYFMKANRAYCDTLGYREEELASRKFFDITHPEDVEKHRAIQRKVDAGEVSSYELEKRYIHKDGHVVHGLLRVSLVRNSDGKPLYLLGQVLDITERKRAEQQIREYSENLERMVGDRTKELNRALFDMEEARDRIDGILKSVADGLIVTDTYNNIVLMNRAAEDLLGVRLSELIGRPVDFAIEDETLRDRIRSTLGSGRSGYQFDLELPGGQPDQPRIMRARTSLIEDKDGNQTGIITIIHDVTYEREVDRMKTEFLSTAAHELRTPLTSIQGFSELLLSRDDITDDERERFLRYINRQSETLARIISDLLDISRIESGKGYVMNRVPTDISALVDGMLPYFRVQTDRHRFETDFPDPPVVVLADREKIEQVIENVVGNAVKYSPGGGVIRIAGEVTGNRYILSVEDEGIGMTAEQVERIFDKFYRADMSDTVASGTGLGMSIVKHIVDAHGGDVRVESEFGKGTTVVVSIPL